MIIVCFPLTDEDPETTSPSTTLSTTEPASTEKVTTTESSEFIAAQKEIEEARQHNMVLKYALVAVGGVSAVLLIAICVIGIVVYKVSNRFTYYSTKPVKVYVPGLGGLLQVHAYACLCLLVLYLELAKKYSSLFIMPELLHQVQWDRDSQNYLTSLKMTLLSM